MRYRIFDFEVESEILLPCEVFEATHLVHEPAKWQLEIIFRPRPDWVFERANLIGRRFWGCAYHVGNGILISTISGVAMHFHGDGQRIEVCFDLQSAFQSAQVGAWVINLGMAICHLLRGGISLHGASVKYQGRLFAMMAASGTGKSTLLWRLLDGGALFCGDDLLPIHVGEEVLATPSHSLHGKLSGAALQNRGFSPECFEEIVPGANEFWVPISAVRRTFQKRQPTALFILSPFVAGEAEAVATPIFARRHRGADAVSFLMANTHSLWAASDFLHSKTMMGKYLQLANEVPIFTLHYQRDFAVLSRVREALAQIVSAHPNSIS